MPGMSFLRRKVAGSFSVTNVRCGVRADLGVERFVARAGTERTGNAHRQRMMVVLARPGDDNFSIRI